MYVVGPAVGAAGAARVRRDRRLPDSRRRGQHRDRRLQRRAQPGRRGRRAARLVSPSASRATAPRIGIIYLIVGLQIFTIVASRGDVYVLGEAYAFGVVWSFVFKALSMVVLRFKDRRPRAWKVPLNLRVGGVELPIGLIAHLSGAAGDGVGQPADQAGGHRVGCRRSPWCSFADLRRDGAPVAPAQQRRACISRSSTSAYTPELDPAPSRPAQAVRASSCRCAIRTT